MVRANLHKTFGFLLLASATLVGCTVLIGCTLYQSEKREVLEKNQGGVITSGFNVKLQTYYECSVDFALPDFVKEPLEVVDTEFEAQNISVLVNPAAESSWVVAYHHTPESRAHTYCKVISLKSSAAPALQNVVNLSLEKLLPLL